MPEKKAVPTAFFQSIWVGRFSAQFQRFGRLDRCWQGGLSKNSMAGLATVSMLAVACAAPTPPADPALASSYEQVINEVVESAIDDLVSQMRRLAAFAPASKVEVKAAGSAGGKADEIGPPRIALAIDRSVGETGQASVASQLFDSSLLQMARRKLTQFEIVEISPTVLGRVQYVLGGKLSRVDVGSRSRGMYRVDLMLTDIKTSRIVAQSSVRFQAQGVDLTPLGTGTTP
jgi:hypothetical protein